MNHRHSTALLASVGIALACGGTTGLEEGATASNLISRHAYRVGGTISGLSGTIVFQDNATDDLSRTVNGSFTFATALRSGSTYSVTLLSQPAGQTCTVTHGSGTIARANVTSVAVSCTTNVLYTVGGSISGLSGTVVLQNTGKDDLALSANGPFTFATALADGSTYSVTVISQPAGQTCAVANGSGTIAGANVTNAAVSCTTNPLYTVGGAISGLSGIAVLQDNGTDDLTLGADGSFGFATPLADGATYDVRVLSQPAGQICKVANRSGAIAGANVTNVAVSCVAGTYYTLGGTVSGLSGTLVLNDTAGDVLTLTVDGSFTFPTPLADGSTYTVWVASWPPNQICAIPNAVANGTIAGANVTNVAVSCAPVQFGAGYCIVDSMTGQLTGECFDLYCAVGLSPYCSGTPNGPLVWAACGPLVDSTFCIY
jgi:trimeric autotransporter adhesin